MNEKMQTSKKTVTILDAILESGRVLGIEHFKTKQLEALRSVLGGKDTFVSLPTGYGKSVIFDSLPTAFDFLKGEYYLECLAAACVDGYSCLLFAAFHCLVLWLSILNSLT